MCDKRYASAGGVALPARIAESLSTSTSLSGLSPAPTCCWRRETSSARRMSIFPCSKRRWYETSCSCCWRSSINALRSASDRVARSGRGSIQAFRSEGQLTSRAAKGQPQLERWRSCPRLFALMQHVLDEAAELLFELRRSFLGVALSVDVDERLVGVGEYLRPASRVEDLDPVAEVDVPALQTLGQHAHDESLLRPGARHLPVDDVRRGKLGDELRQRTVRSCEQLEELAEARDGVVGRQEFREHVAAADGAREDDAVLGRRLRQRGERRGCADDLEAAALDDSLDLACDGDREGKLAAPAVAPDQPEVQQERLLDRDFARRVVNEIHPLGRPVENDAEVSADRADKALRLADEAPQRRRLAGSNVRRERMRGDGLDTERPQEQRQDERGRRVAVVDDDPEAPAADRFHVEACEQVVGVALAGTRGVADLPHLARRDPPPIVTSSPTATSSWIRTCERMSQFRPTIAFSISALRPMCVAASTTDATVRARSRSVTLDERTEYGPTVASGAIRQ